jgi:molybdopterin converting factor small subunit
MPISIIIFGQLTDILGNSLSLDDIPDTDNLVKKLNKLYPELVNKKYVIAVDKKVITANTTLSNSNTVALLPPFSGG